MMAPARALPVLCALVLAVLAGHAAANVITVTSSADTVGTDGGCTLREAIIVAQGTNLTDCAPGDHNPNQPDEIEIAASVTSITVASSLVISDYVSIRSLARTELNGADAHVIMQITASDTFAQPRVEISNIDFVGGFTDTDGEAGALMNAGVTQLIDCTFTGNRALLPNNTDPTEGVGGAIRNTGTLFISGAASLFDSNVARSINDYIGAPIGGAIYSSGALEIRDAQFLSNRAFENYTLGVPSTGTAAASGAVFARQISGEQSASVYVHDTLFNANDGCVGGAITAADAVVRLFDVTFEGNRAEYHGGAVWSTLDVHWHGGDAVENNVAERGSGGVLLAVDGSVFVEGVQRFTSNGAYQYGGVVHAPESEVTFRSIPYGFIYSSARYGGLVHSGDRVTFDAVGDVTFNDASRGAVVYAQEEIRVHGMGQLAGNTAYRSLFQAGSGVLMESVESITSNTASFGRMFTGVDVRLRDVGGVVSNYGREGLFYGTEHVFVSGVGSIAYNTMQYSSNYAAFLAGNGGYVEDVVASLYTSAIRGNVSGPRGLFSSLNAEFILRRVTGDIADNQYGVVYADRDAAIYDVTGDIGYNISYRPGAVVHSTNGRAVLRNLSGDIYSSLLGGGASGGGALSGRGGVYVSDISGDIHSHTGGEYGGFAYSEYGDVVVERVGGDVFNHSASLYGAVLCARDGTAVLREVGGMLQYNFASYGGVVYATHARIEDVNGPLFYNGANFYGGVACVLDSAHIVNVGTMIGNGAGSLGGVAYGQRLYVANVNGDVLYSYATGGSVLAAYPTNENGAYARLYNVSGSIYANGSSDYGGVVYAYSADATISGVGGNIHYNYSALYGGVVYSYSPAEPVTVVIEDVYGDVAYNGARSGPVVHTVNAGLVRVESIGDFAYNSFYDYALGAPGAIYAQYAGVRATDVYIRNVGVIAVNPSVVSAHGDIDVYNVGGIYGSYGYAYSEAWPAFESYAGSIRIQYVGGDIAGHFTTNGGAAVAHARVGSVFVAYTGSIAYNTNVYGTYGGALYSPTAVVVRDVGDVYANTVGYVRLSECAFGAFAASGARVTIDGAGSLLGNTAASSIYDGSGYCTTTGGVGGGGVAYARDELVVRNVTGDVAYNYGVMGGAFLSLGRLVVEHVGGDIAYNAAVAGGALFGSSVLAVRDVYGAVVGNSASSVSANHQNVPEYGRGGAVAGQDKISVVRTGPVIGNSSYNGGGAFSSSGGNVRVEDTGVVAYNSSSASVGRGGVILAYDAGELVGVRDTAYYGGGVFRNSAASGGVIYAISAVLADVYGDVSDNEALADYGGVLFGEYDATIQNVYGSVSYNRATQLGGVAVSGVDAAIRNVTGDVSFNSATAGGALFGLFSTISGVAGNVSYNAALIGGVMLGEYVGVIEDIGGSIANNYAAGFGGVISAYGGGNSVYIRRVGGDVYANYAFTYYAVAAAYDVTLEDIAGDISYNEAGAGISLFAVDSGRGVVNNIGGSISNNLGQPAIVAELCTRVTVSNVLGDISYHNAGADAGFGGGGFLFSECNTYVSNVGRIEYNYTGYGYGGFLYATGPGSKSHFTDVAALAYNRAGITGGAVFGYEVKMTRIGDIVGNVAELGSGGAVSSSGSLIANELGNISYNSANDRGGVLLGTNRLEVSGTGNIEYNSAVHGGAFCSFGLGLISNTGAVRYNSASGRGGALNCGESRFGIGSCSWNGVYGNVEYNTALLGTVMGTSGISDMMLENVYGDVSYNSAEEGGGVLFASFGLASLRTVSGNVSYNVAGSYFSDYGGGVAYGGSGALVQRVQGDVYGNRSYTYGGVAASLYGATVADVYGSVSGNDAALFGGVAYSENGSASVAGVALDVSYNSTAYGGGVVCATSGVGTVSNVGGAVSYNNTTVYSGGVVFAYQSLVEEIAGEVAYNEAQVAGGVALGFIEVKIKSVYAVANNTAGYNGGVAFSYGTLLITGVQSMSRNEAASGSGGVGIAYSTARVSDIGVMEYNAAQISGGVIVGVASLQVSGVDAIMYNSAEYGGAFYTDGDGTVTDVASVVGNSAAELGGVVYANGANVVNVRERLCSNSARLGGAVYGYTTAQVVTGLEYGPAFFDNSAEFGGVAYGGVAVTVDAGSGIIAGNNASSAGDVSYAPDEPDEDVHAAVVAQGGGAAITVVQQPSDGVERVALPQQPWVAVEGAESERPLALVVTLVEQPSGEVAQQWDIEEFDVTFGDTVRVHDLAVEAPGTYSLEFSLVTPDCDASGNDTVTVSSVETDTFEVFECFTPSPAVCPEQLVELVSGVDACEASFNLTAPTTDECSEFTLESSESPQGPFAVGRTRFVWTLSNEAGEEDRCVVDVVVADEQAPSVQCQDVVVAADAGQCTAIVDVPQPTVTDNCGGARITSDRVSPVFPVGDTVVVFTATDASGNRAQCASVVTVVDEQAPEIFCAAARSERECDEEAAFAFPQALDNCRGVAVTQVAGVAQGEPLRPGVNRFEFVATDAAGLNATCEFEVLTNSTWYFDGDSDGVGGGAPVFGCPSPGVGWIRDVGGDCDDTRASLGLTVYADLDEDTWGSISNTACVEYDFFDVDGPAPVDDDARRRRRRQQRSVEGVVFVARSGDCDDSNPFINPEAREECNGLDDNCNGLIDEGITCTGIQIIVTESTTTYPMPSIPRAPIAPPAPIIEISLPTPLPTAPTPRVTSEGDDFTDKRFTGLIAFRSSTRSASAASLVHVPAVAAVVLAIAAVLMGL